MTFDEWVVNTLGVFDVLGALVLIWANQRITTAAGFSSPAKRWALFRRMIYCIGAIAFFVLGIGRFSGHYDATTYEAVSHSMLVFIILVFPVLRAVGWITQDTFLDGVRSDPSQRQARIDHKDCG
jgi:hypothetical protein